MVNENLIELLFSEVLVKEIEIKKIMPCTAGPNRIKFLAQADKLLGDVVPILYLAIPNAIYAEEVGAVSYRYKQHLITISATGQIAATYVKDIAEAKELIAEIKKIINRAFIYFKIHGKPDDELLELKRQATPMKIYQNLPRTNCKECGEQTCFVFAAKLLNGEKTLQECPPLQLVEYSSNRSYLEKMLYPIKL